MFSWKIPVFMVSPGNTFLTTFCYNLKITANIFPSVSTVPSIKHLWCRGNLMLWNQCPTYSGYICSQWKPCWSYDIRTSYIHILLHNWGWNDVIPGYIAIGVIGIYFESTPGITPKYFHMTPGCHRIPGGPMMLMYAGKYPNLWFLRKKHFQRKYLSKYIWPVPVDYGEFITRYINPSIVHLDSSEVVLNLFLLCN